MDFFYNPQMDEINSNLEIEKNSILQISYISKFEQYNVKDLEFSSKFYIDPDNSFR